jgi:hypothetical protein
VTAKVARRKAATMLTFFWALCPKAPPLGLVRVPGSSSRSEIDVEDSGSGRKERIYIRSTSTPKHYTYNSFPFHI